MNDWIAAILLGALEGLTEFLPISSTGHLLIVENWLSPVQNWPDLQRELFTVIIQPAAVMAVIAVFYNRLLQMASNWRDPKTLDYIIKLGAAFVITAVGGLALTKLGFTLPKEVKPIAWATLIGGFVIFAIEWRCKNKPLLEEITWRAAVVVGLAQVLAAVFPGASRSGSCIMFAMLAGLSRPAATEFSFLVGIPTMLAAGGYEIYKWMKAAHHTTQGATPHAVQWGVVAVGMAVSAIVAFLVVRWLLRFVQSHTFKGFAWYRLAMGGALLAWLMRSH
jgi:undecaprenyl-diphosphatase